MHVLLIMFGAILALFGGGCTLILGGDVVFGGNPVSALEDVGVLLLVLGLLPLAAGYFMIRSGLRIDREKRRASTAKE